jgi:hypothetical protein
MTMTDSDNCLIAAANGHELFDIPLDDVISVRFVLKVLDHSNPLLSHDHLLSTCLHEELCSPHTTRLRIEKQQQQALDVPPSIQQFAAGGFR